MILSCSKKLYSELKTLLLEEHSAAQKKRIADSVENHKIGIVCLLFISGSDEKIIPQRAAWVISELCDRNQDLLLPYLEYMTNIFYTTQNESVLRNFSRTLSLMPFDNKNLGQLLNRAFTLIENQMTPIAVRVHCITIVHRISKIEPDITNELRIVLEGLVEAGSGGEKSRARKLLRKLE